MSPGRERLAEAAIPGLEVMGWDDPAAAAQLLAAMTREISPLEFDAGHPLPASRRALRRFLAGVKPPMGILEHIISKRD